MTLSLDRAFAIAMLCRRLLLEANIRRAPVSTDLLHRLNPELEVRLAPLGALPAALRLAADHAAAEIFVNESLPVPEQRFCIAHEYGHYLLHARHALAVYGHEAAALPALKEREADCFALHLLAPLHLLDTWAPKRLPDDDRPELVTKLASHFNLSAAAARAALSHLRYARAALR